jgi:hypothetical protein
MKWQSALFSPYTVALILGLAVFASALAYYGTSFV